MTRFARAALTVILTAGIAGGVLGCGPGDTPTPPPPPTATPAATPAAFYQPPAGGEIVAVDPDAPLPAAVIKDLTVRSAVPIQAIAENQYLEPGVPDDAVEAGKALTRIVTGTDQTTTRHLIVVYPYFGIPDSDQTAPSQWLWTSTSGSAPVGIVDKAARVAEVEQFIAAADDASAYDLLVLDSPGV